MLATDWPAGQRAPDARIDNMAAARRCQLLSPFQDDERKMSVFADIDIHPLASAGVARLFEEPDGPLAARQGYDITSMAQPEAVAAKNNNKIISCARAPGLAFFL